MSLDYAELDCLRDQKTEQLYIVDVNLTPNGPPNGLSVRDRKKIIISFATWIVKKLHDA